MAQCTAFRVHRSRFSRHPNGFAEVLGIPRLEPLETKEQYKRCPRLYVADRTYDFKQLLLWSHGTDVLKPFSKIPRGHRQLLAESTALLETLFTDDFLALDWLERTGQSNDSVTISPENAIEAVDLIRLLDFADMLPTALYLCCRLSPRYLFHGAPRAYGAAEVVSRQDQV
ncbi:hypothetical protein BV20DRAFT_1056397 [Pilatotrama ljubarskyi]|nr:hypothetical protein BV20DRAFT_1056397 [Pilatotrama ljubarskyi]